MATREKSTVKTVTNTYLDDVLIEAGEIYVIWDSTGHAYVVRVSTVSNDRFYIDKSLSDNIVYKESNASYFRYDSIYGIEKF